MYVREQEAPCVSMAEMMKKFQSSIRENHQWKNQLTEPKSPIRHTLFRARPPRIKSSMELGKEELEKVPQFKARPLNRKIPPKPEPKPCTKPEPFQLESFLRHEKEMQREMEKRRRMEMEEAQMRIFKAQSILKEDPFPVPKKKRRPLTEVQDFNVHVNHRASGRAEFDKIIEKEMTYKQSRKEAESARMMEEKALKQLRRTLAPHARQVPNFDHPFLLQKFEIKGVRKAKSSKHHINSRNEKQRAVCLSARASCAAAASHMR